MTTQKSAPSPIARSTNPPRPLRWPGELKRTAIRLEWHRRLAECPHQLSLRELSERLDQSYASVAFWAKMMKYPFVLLKRGRKSLIDWGSLDWSLKNCELARQVGVSGERIRQVRLARNIAPVPRMSEVGRKFRQYLMDQRIKTRRWSVAELIAQFGSDVPAGTARSVLRSLNGAAKNGKR